VPHEHHPAREVAVEHHGHGPRVDLGERGAVRSSQSRSRSRLAVQQEAADGPGSAAAEPAPSGAAPAVASAAWPRPLMPRSSSAGHPDQGHGRPAASARRQTEGNRREGRARQEARSGSTEARFRSSTVVWQGQDSNLCRRSRRFYRSPHRVVAGPLPSPPIAGDVRKRRVGSSGRPSASPPVPPVPRGLALGGGKAEGIPATVPCGPRAATCVLAA
jgi:hypothetical protein